MLQAGLGPLDLQIGVRDFILVDGQLLGTLEVYIFVEDAVIVDEFGIFVVKRLD